MSDQQVLSALITSNAQLQDFCQRSTESAFLCLDTEFLLGKTYWSQLCLIQVASEQEAVIIDPLAEGLDLQYLFALLSGPAVKVFHSAYHDLELLHRTSANYGSSFVPAPLFDTQIAAMACGYRENMSLQDLVLKVTGHRISKSKIIRNSDWSRRDLSGEQLRYALSDVVYLRALYLGLISYLRNNQREHWLDQEWEKLIAPARYQAVEPDQSWKNIQAWDRQRPLFMVLLRDTAAWRERKGQELNLARNLLLSDELLVNLAEAIASDSDSYSFVDQCKCYQLFCDLLGRNSHYYRYLFFGRRGERGEQGAMLQRELAAVIQQSLLWVQQNGFPPPPPFPPAGQQRLRSKSMCSLLQTLLEIKCESWKVAPKLIASIAELQMLAADCRAQIPAMSGWRYEVFGSEAIALKQGQVGIGIRNNRVCLLSTIADAESDRPPSKVTITSNSGAMIDETLGTDTPVAATAVDESGVDESSTEVTEGAVFASSG